MLFRSKITQNRIGKRYRTPIFYEIDDVLPVNTDAGYKQSLRIFSEIFNITPRLQNSFVRLSQDLENGYDY